MHTSTLFRRVSRDVRKCKHAPTPQHAALARAHADDLLCAYAPAGYVVQVADDAEPKHLRLYVHEADGAIYHASVHVLSHDVVVTVTTHTGVSTNHVRKMLMHMDRL